MKKPRRTESQKAAERKKAEDDPLNYVRRDPPIYNPIDWAKYFYVKHQSKNSKIAGTPFRETVTRSLYGIPTTEELMRLRQTRERAIESEIEREAKKEAERQFREPTVRPVKSGYEFQILKP